MAKSLRPVKIIVLATIFILSATTAAVAISSLETKGAAFASCRVTGCHTNLELAVISGIIAVVSFLALVGMCLGGGDNYKRFSD
jgi:hypothetical protein